MKKKLSIAVCVLFFAVIGVMVYYETHFTCYESKEVPISDERILKEMPDIALTDADLALGETILSDPEVIEAMRSGEIVSLPDALAEQLAEGYLPEDTEMFSFCVLGDALYVDYFETPEKRVMLAFFKEDAYGPQKTIALYNVRGDDQSLRICYSNDRGELSKIKESRRWFSYFRDRMWED